MRHRSLILAFLAILPAILVMVYSIITRQKPEILVVLLTGVISLQWAWFRGKVKVLVKTTNAVIAFNDPILHEHIVSDLQRTQVPVGLTIKKEGRTIGSALRGTQLKFNDSYDGQDRAEQQWVYIPDLQLQQTDSLRPPLYDTPRLTTYNDGSIASRDQVNEVLKAFPHTACDGESHALDSIDSTASQAATPIDFSVLFMDSQPSNDELILAYSSTEEQTVSTPRD